LSTHVEVVNRGRPYSGLGLGLMDVGMADLDLLVVDLLQSDIDYEVESNTAKVNISIEMQ